MKIKSPRRKHSVKANVQILDLTRKGSSMTFEIFANEEKIRLILDFGFRILDFGFKERLR